jgi:hypothetical protein
VAGVPAGSAIILTDIAGRAIWQQQSVSGSVNVPAQNLSPGLYLLRVNTQQGAGRSFKLLRE